MDLQRAGTRVRPAYTSASHVRTVGHSCEALPQASSLLHTLSRGRLEASPEMAGLGEDFARLIAFSTDWPAVHL